MPLRDLLKKKDKIEESLEVTPAGQPGLEPPEFKIVRSDTHTQEVLDSNAHQYGVQTTPSRPAIHARSPSRSQEEEPGSAKREKKRLSDLLHLNKDRSRASSTSSSNLPSNLPEVQNAYSEKGDQLEKEAEWEQRATILASARPRTPVAASNPAQGMSQLNINGRPTLARSVSDVEADVNIQEAIRLHDEGSFEQSTRMFKQLADQGNVLSEVLYGLSLRHGWGCPKDEARAFTYLSSAASNSAALEAAALKAGLKKGGAAKGELVLAIFELGNCFRYGWGTQIDKAAARQYYETAANLGDTDAMNEAAWCYLEGFGGKKDKFKAAQLLRLAEKNGSKTLGNSWIWKEKYNPQ